MNLKSKNFEQMEEEGGEDSNLSLTEIRKHEIYLRLRMNLGVSIATVAMAILQLIVAIMMGATLFQLRVHDYYLMMLICGLAAFLAAKYRKLIIGGWMTTMIYAYSNIMEVILRESILQSILYNAVVMMFPIFFNFKIRDTIISLSINFLLLIGSIIASIIRFDTIKESYTKSNIILELIGCVATLLITQLISMLDHKIRQQMASFMRSSLGLEGRNKVLLINDNPLLTEKLFAALLSKGIELYHTMHIKKALQMYKFQWKKIGIIVLDSMILGEEGCHLAKLIRQHESTKNINPVMFFILIEKQIKIIKQKKKVKKRKNKRYAKTEGQEPEEEEMEKEQVNSGGTKAKFDGFNVTKFLEHPVNIADLAIDIKALNFA